MTAQIVHRVLCAAEPCVKINNFHSGKLNLKRYTCISNMCVCVFVGVRHQIKSSNFGIIILNCARLENAIIVCPENKSKEILKQNSKLSKFFEAN